jgi:hypothetical protein
MHSGGESCAPNLVRILARTSSGSTARVHNRGALWKPAPCSRAARLLGAPGRTARPRTGARSGPREPPCPQALEEVLGDAGQLPERALRIDHEHVQHVAAVDDIESVPPV